MESFEIHDLISGNVFDVFDHESDALEALVAYAVDQGLKAVARFALLRERDGASSLVAMEDDLVELVRSIETKPVLASGMYSGRGPSQGI